MILYFISRASTYNPGNISCSAGVDIGLPFDIFYRPTLPLIAIVLKSVCIVIKVMCLNVCDFGNPQFMVSYHYMYFSPLGPTDIQPHHMCLFAFWFVPEYLCWTQFGN